MVTNIMMVLAVVMVLEVDMKTSPSLYLIFFSVFLTPFSSPFSFEPNLPYTISYLTRLSLTYPYIPSLAPSLVVLPFLSFPLSITPLHFIVLVAFFIVLFLSLHFLLLLGIFHLVFPYFFPFFHLLILYSFPFIPPFFYSSLLSFLPFLFSQNNKVNKLIYLYTYKASTSIHSPSKQCLFSSMYLCAC